MVNLGYKNNFYKILKNGVVIDCIPLLLYLYGLYGDKTSKSFEKFIDIKGLEVLDCDALENFFKPSIISRLIVTPPVLTEVDNWIRNKVKGSKQDMFLKKSIGLLRNLKELHQGKNLIYDHIYFNKIGFTDTSVISAAENEGCVILTHDHELVGRAKKKKLNVLDIYTIRADYMTQKLSY